MFKSKDAPKKTFQIMVASAFIVSMAAATTAHAAIVASTDGVVYVNRGEGFNPASAGDALKPGDRIRTRKGSVRILYDNGCSVLVGPRRLAVVPSKPPLCHQALTSPAHDAGVAPLDPGVTTVSTLGAAPFLAGVGVALAIGVSSGDKGSSFGAPASP